MICPQAIKEICHLFHYHRCWFVEKSPLSGFRGSSKNLHLSHLSSLFPRRVTRLSRPRRFITSSPWHLPHESKSSSRRSSFELHRVTLDIFTDAPRDIKPPQQHFSHFAHFKKFASLTSRHPTPFGPIPPLPNPLPRRPLLFFDARV